MTLICLTLHRPWTQSILNGPKRIENRSWPPPQKYIGTTIALHAGEKWDDDGEAFMRKQGFIPPLGKDEEPRQCIVGLVKIMAAHELKPLQTLMFDALAARHVQMMKESPWAFGPWCWILDFVRPLKTPVPCTGHQGLWVAPVEIESMVNRVASTY